MRQLDKDQAEVQRQQKRAEKEMLKVKEEIDKLIGNTRDKAPMASAALKSPRTPGSK